MGKLRDQTHNEGFHFKRRPDMLPLEAITRIRVLSERGMGSKAIAKSMGISRNTVRKYLSHFQTLTPISSEVQRPSRLDSFRDQIHEWFLACRGYCPVVKRKIGICQDTSKKLVRSLFIPEEPQQGLCPYASLPQDIFLT